MKKVAGVVGLVLVAIFLILGFTSTAPDKYIKSYGDNKMYEYVGGDAYNYIIEASLRGGEIAGAMTAKAIYFGVAGILLVLSIAFLCADEGSVETRSEISNTRNAIKNVETAIGKLEGTVIENQRKNDVALKKIIDQQAASLPQDSASINDMKSTHE